MNDAAFFSTARAKFGRLSQLQVDGINAVLEACAGAPLAHAAYMLATAWHETGTAMQPVRESPNASEAWRKAHFRYWPHYGRGLVQITHLRNYEWLDDEAANAGLTKPGEILGNIDLALRPDIAALALRKGLDEGRYDAQGKTMPQRLPTAGRATLQQYIKARYLVNIQDKATLIAGYAQNWEAALIAGGWA